MLGPGLSRFHVSELRFRSLRYQVPSRKCKCVSGVPGGVSCLKLQTLSVGVQDSTFTSGTPGSTFRVPGFNPETSDPKFQTASFNSRVADSKLKESNFKVHVSSFIPGPP